MWTVELAPEFEPELLALAVEVRIELLAQARVIERFGPTTGRPRVDTLNGSKHANMTLTSNACSVAGQAGDMEVSMPRTLDQVVAELPKSERTKIEARAWELIDEEMSLQDLRKAVGKTQTAIAKRLKVGQDAVSKLEARSDMYISTLRNVLKAMGGELELIARFPGRPPVRLAELGAVTPRRRAARRPAA